MTEPGARYAVSISLEEAASGCRRTIELKSSETCPSCGGAGKKAGSSPAVCPQCSGTGQLCHVHPIEVKIPAGIEDSCQLCIKTNPQPAQRGKIPGEINVLVSVKAHPLFQRAGADIVHELSLNFAQAALGTDVVVPTLMGEAKLKIPPGTQTGKVFRLKGKGMPHFGKSGKGDLVINVVVVTPTVLDEQQRRLLEQLAQNLPRPLLGKGNTGKKKGDG